MRPSSRSALRLICRESLNKRTRGSALSFAYFPSTATSNLRVCSCSKRAIRTSPSLTRRKSSPVIDSQSVGEVTWFPPYQKQQSGERRIAVAHQKLTLSRYYII